MLSDETLITVVNRDTGTVSYPLPDTVGMYRCFQPFEKKQIPMGELRKISYKPGCKVLLKDYLVIQNEEAVKEIVPNYEPEYFYTKEQIKDLLENGSLNAFLDCLDFAPDGVIDIIKKMAVELPLNDVNKRKAILQKTGYNIDNVIRINEEAQEEKVTEQKVRRTNIEKQEESKTPVNNRRAAPPKYDVVNSNE